MKVKKQLTLTGRIIFLSVAIIMGASCKEKPKKMYAPTFESLDSHPTPVWFRDAKFGDFYSLGSLLSACIS